MLIKKFLSKLNLTFLFSPFRSNIKSIDTKMFIEGFQERMFSIKEQCSWISLSVHKYFFLLGIWKILLIRWLSLKKMYAFF